MLALALITVNGLLVVPGVASAAPSYTVEESPSGESGPSTPLRLFGIDVCCRVKKLSTTATGRLNLPFPVTLYGKKFSAIKVSMDGTIQWGPGPGIFNGANESLPSDAFGNRGVLAAYWGDLDYLGSESDSVYVGTNGFPPNRTFTIRWRSRHSTDDFEVVNAAVTFLESEPTIYVNYGAGSGRYHTVGIQKSATGPATQYSHNSISLAPGSQSGYVPTP